MAATQFSRHITVWDCLDHRRPLGRRIEAERRRLQKANAVLKALECALNEEEIEPIVAADAANVVRGLIDHAIDRLDPMLLARGEVRESAADSGASEAKEPQATPDRATQNEADDDDREI